MRSNNIFVYVPIILTCLCASCLMIIPINPAYKWLRPDLVTLVLIYWVANMPNHIGVVFAFIIGILFDLLNSMLLGTMGLTLAIIAFLTINLRLRIRIYRTWQKFVIIMLLVACSQLIRLWIQMVIGHPPTTFVYWASSLISAIVWPLVNKLLNTLKYSLKYAAQ